jgi:hypothetical protein
MRHLHLIAFVVLFVCGCDKDDEPQIVYISKTTNGSVTYEATYSETRIDNITTVKNSDGSVIKTINFIYAGDSVYIDDFYVSVYKFSAGLLTKKYYYEKTKPFPILGTVRYQYNGSDELERCIFSYSSASSTDSTVLDFEWQDGNIAEFTNSVYNDGAVIDTYTRTCTYDNKKNLSNGNVFAAYVMPREDEVFGLCKNNLMRVDQSDDAFHLCCYNYEYNGSGYPSHIKDPQAQQWTVSYVKAGD